MKYSRYGYVAIICLVIVFAAPIWSIEDSLLATIPQPEEIEEAFRSGLIEYTDYIILLEIVNRGELSRADSLFLLSFPDLLMGLSTDQDELITSPTEIDNEIDTSRKNLVHCKAVLRNNYRLKSVSDRSNTLRCDLTAGFLGGYAHVEREYDGTAEWKRRSMSYRFARRNANMTIGNYSTRFGLGVVYGYHGRLLSLPDDRDEAEEFLFPSYGGGNGIKVDWRGHSLIVDLDRNEEFASQFMGVSLSTSKCFTINAAYGRVANRMMNESRSAGYVSLAGNLVGHSRTRFELAAGLWDSQLRSALVAQSMRKMGPVKSELTIWYYDTEYPSFFSGSVSSRRSRTRYLEDIDFSYSNRRAGEAGGIARTTYMLTSKTRIISKAAYSYRNSYMNRLEIEAGVRRELSKDYRVNLTGLYRRDSLIAGDDVEQKVQAELIRKRNGWRTRLAVRYRLDSHHKFKYYTIYVENRLVNIMGSVYIIYKLDKLYLSDIKNNYTFLSCTFEAQVGKHVSTELTYSFRYDRGSTENYGTVRWDVVWDI
ncbi:MAG: hypothetical protein R3F48_07445 [Candidatus Zixiibacteriota bacterium]